MIIGRQQRLSSLIEPTRLHKKTISVSCTMLFRLFARLSIRSSLFQKSTYSKTASRFMGQNYNLRVTRTGRYIQISKHSSTTIVNAPVKA